MCAWCCDKTCVDRFISTAFWAVLNGFLMSMNRDIVETGDVLMGLC